MHPRSALPTSRLRLEPVAARHALGLYQAALGSRAQLLPWMPWADEITLESNQNYSAEAARSWEEGGEFHFAVIENDLVLGVTGLNRGHDRSADNLGLQRFTLWAGVDNRASRRVAEKLGFRDVGPLPEPMRGGLGTFAAEGYERPAPASEVRDEVKRLHG